MNNGMDGNVDGGSSNRTSPSYGRPSTSSSSVSTSNSIISSITSNNVQTEAVDVALQGSGDASEVVETDVSLAAVATAAATVEEEARGQHSRRRRRRSSASDETSTLNTSDHILTSVVVAAAASSSSSSSSSSVSLKKQKQHPGSSHSMSSTGLNRSHSLRMVSYDAKKVWKNLPVQWTTGDLEFILTALTKSKTLPSKSEFERRFPQHIRFNKQVVLAFAQRHDFPALYEERHLFVPRPLSGDKDVIMAYCRKIPRSLQDASDELCDDRDVVMAALERDGIEIQYASHRLREDYDLVKFACERNGNALMFCPMMCEARRRIITDRQFMHDVVLRPWMDRLNHDATTGLTTGISTAATASVKAAGRMWKEIPPSIRLHDRGLVLQALKSGLPFRDVPRNLLSSSGSTMDGDVDVDFVKSAIDGNPALCLQLPPTLHQDHPELVVHAVRSIGAMMTELQSHHATVDGEDSQVDRWGVEHMYQTFKDITVIAFQSNGSAWPLLRQDRDAVLIVCTYCPVDIVRRTLTLGRSPLCDDYEIIKRAVERFPALFRFASERLKAEPQIIMPSITRDTALDRIRSLPASVRQDHPEVVARCIALAFACHLNQFQPYITADMWDNQQICQAWIRRGFCLSAVPNLQQKFQHDHDLALELAEYHWECFGEVGYTLLNDKPFMLRAVERDGRVLRFANEDTRDDFDLLVVAFSRHGTQRQYVVNGVPPPSARSIFGAMSDLFAFESKLREKLDLHNAFMYNFLRGITCQDDRQVMPPGHRSKLPMLARGTETSDAFKHLIAEFCGVPVGRELARLRKALINLRRPRKRNEVYIAAKPVEGPDTVAEGPVIEGQGAIRGGAQQVPPGPGARRDLGRVVRGRGARPDLGRVVQVPPAAARPMNADDVQVVPAQNNNANIVHHRLAASSLRAVGVVIGIRQPHNDGNGVANDVDMQHQIRPLPRMMDVELMQGHQPRDQQPLPINLVANAGLGVPDGGGDRAAVANIVGRQSQHVPLGGEVAGRTVNRDESPLAIGIAPVRNGHVDGNLDNIVQELNEDLRSVRQARQEATELERRVQLQQQETEARRVQERLERRLRRQQRRDEARGVLLRAQRDERSGNIIGPRQGPVPMPRHNVAGSGQNGNNAGAAVGSVNQQQLLRTISLPIRRVEPTAPLILQPHRQMVDIEAYIERANELARRRAEIIQNFSPDDEAAPNAASARREIVANHSMEQHRLQQNQQQ